MNICFLEFSIIPIHEWLGWDGSLRKFKYMLYCDFLSYRNWKDEVSG